MRKKDYVHLVLQFSWTTRYDINKDGSKKKRQIMI